jgi:hypothetical protein
MDKSIQIKINNKTYTVVLNDNCCAYDILNMLPMELELRRYAGHEYYSSLPETPTIKGVAMTSEAHAGGLYYFNGWNAFTIVFEDAHIAPYKVVHIGDVDKEVITHLASEGKTVIAEFTITKTHNT